MVASGTVLGVCTLALGQTARVEGFSGPRGERVVVRQIERGQAGAAAGECCEEEVKAGSMTGRHGERFDVLLDEALQDSPNTGKQRVIVQMTPRGHAGQAPRVLLHHGGQPEGREKNVIVRRIEPQGDGKGGACPACGHALGGEQRSFTFRGGSGPQVGGFWEEDERPRVRREIHRKIEREAVRGDVRSFGKVIIVGPDGEQQEFNFGDGPEVRREFEIRLEGGQPSKGEGAGGSSRIKLRGPLGQNPSPPLPPPPPSASGRGESGLRIEGKAIIIGPDGERRELKLDGGKDGGSFFKVLPRGGRSGNANPGAAPDGDMVRLHLDEVMGPAKQDQTVKVRRIRAGGSVL